MLKIKDNVDLKVLEKYGYGTSHFHIDNRNASQYILNNSVYSIVIIILIYTREILLYDTSDFALDVLYDLIQDDLIEKV